MVLLYFNILRLTFTPEIFVKGFTCVIRGVHLLGSACLLGNNMVLFSIKCISSCYVHILMFTHEHRLELLAALDMQICYLILVNYLDKL